MGQLETNRLILRRFKDDDFVDFFQYISNPKVTEYQPYGPMNGSQAINELHGRIINKEYIAVALKENNKVIGNLYLGNRDYFSKELGFVFNDKYWRQGYGKEACKAIIDYCFVHGVHRIYGQCDCKNEASWRLFESLGFTREACLKKSSFFFVDQTNKPIWKDNYIYSLLNPNED